MSIFIEDVSGHGRLMLEEMSPPHVTQSIIGDLTRPSRVDDTIGTRQVTMRTNFRVMQVSHSLTNRRFLQSMNTHQMLMMF